MSIQIRTDGKLIKATGTSQRYLQVSIEAPPATHQSSRRPINIAFVIDRSGSMQGEKIARAREAVIHGIRSLRDEDRFAVVAFDDSIEVVVPSTVSTAEGRQQAIAAVQRVDSRGRTDLCGGWLHGCSEIGQHLKDEAFGRCILLTDGLANVGITQPEQILVHVRELRARLVSTSTLGVGSDFNEFLLGKMAEAGGGNFHFIENAGHIPEFIAAEVGEALAVTARDVEIIVESSDALSVGSLNDFPCKREGNAWHISAGSLFAGQLLEPVIGMSFPAGVVGAETEVRVRVADRDGALGGALPGIALRWADENAHRAEKLDPVVAASVATLLAARTLREALLQNQAGNYDCAREIMFSCLSDIDLYAGDDASVHGSVLELRSRIDEISQSMSPMARKAQHMRSFSMSKDRSIRSARRKSSRVVFLPTASDQKFIEDVIPRLAEADPELFGDLAVDTTLAAGPFAWQRTAPVIGEHEENRLLSDVLSCTRHDQVRIAFVNERLADNWFSHWHPRARSGVVSLADWSGHFGVPAQAFVAYEAVLYGLSALSPDYDSVAIAHAETRGCLFDFCGTRADIEVKLQASDLCPECRRHLERIGIPVARLLPLTRLIRELAIPVPAH
jgi:Ca-activated chloride channel family protein